MLAASLFYFLSYNYAYENYLNPTWEYFGFTIHSWRIHDWITSISLILIGAYFIPLKLSKPSVFIIVIIFVILYVPIITVTMHVSSTPIETYGVLLLAFMFGFLLINILTRVKIKGGLANKRVTVSWVFVRRITVFFWVFSVACLFYYYGAHMNFVSIKDTYVQRSLTTTISVPLFMNYLQPLFIKVVCAFFMAFGLISRQHKWFILGTLGALITYLVTASKSAFMMPFLIAIIFYTLNNAKLYKFWSILVVSSIGALSLGSAIFGAQTFFWKYISILLTFRTLGIPGLSFSQYNDLFSVSGYTWWSHVKGFSLVIPTPSSFANNPNWPNLGLIIGERVYNVDDLNANASFLTGDGVAAAGSLGVVIISLVFALWLRLLDHSSNGWNPKFVILCLVPYSIAITNTHFFTGLLTFGGLFWLVFFRYIALGRDWPAALKKTI